MAVLWEMLYKNTKKYELGALLCHRKTVWKVKTVCTGAVSPHICCSCSSFICAQHVLENDTKSCNDVSEESTERAEHMETWRCICSGGVSGRADLWHWFLCFQPFDLDACLSLAFLTSIMEIAPAKRSHLYERIHTKGWLSSVSAQWGEPVFIRRIMGEWGYAKNLKLVL